MPAKRRVWPWIILAWYAWGWLATAASYIILRGGFITLPPEQATAMATVSDLMLLVGFVVMSAKLVGAVALAMRWVWAFEVLAGSLLASLVALFWNLATTDVYRATGLFGALSTFVGYALAAAVCVYAWHVRRADANVASGA